VWSPDTYTPRHRVLIQTGKTIKGFSLTAFTSLQSGIRFTPMIAGDINGDGLSNDRAFIFAATSSTDSATAATSTALQKLIATGPRRVRSCLSGQLGTVARDNSCVGPWTATMNARVSYFKDLPRLGKRAAIALNLANPLAAADMLLHGNDSRGWGALTIPNPTLLYVRGFDAATQRFKYEVNPRFGATSPRTTSVLSPFRVTLDVRLDLGRSVEAQQVDINLRPPRGSQAPRANADTIKQRFLLGGLGSHAPQDVYGAVLYLKDSLALSADQITRLESARVPFRASIDSMYSVLSNDLASLPASFDADAAARRILDVGNTAWNVMHQQGVPIFQILTPTQAQLLHPFLLVTLRESTVTTYWAAMFGSRWK
jgi:hypothetical protein